MTNKSDRVLLPPTKNELDALLLIAKGYTRAEAAKLLSTSVMGIHGRIKECCRKLYASNSNEAVYRAMQKGLIK